MLFRSVHLADQQLPCGGLALEVAFEAEGLVARDQHDGIDRTVRIVAGGASLAQSLVFEYKRSALRRVTLEAGFCRWSFARLPFRRGGSYAIVPGAPWVRD